MQSCTCFNGSTRRNLSGEYNKRNTCNQQSYTNNKLNHSHSLCVFFVLPAGFKVFFKTVDEIVFLFEINEVPKQKERQPQPYGQYLYDYHINNSFNPD